LGRLVELKTGDKTILVESSEVESEGVVQAGAVETAEKNLDKLLGVINPFCDSLLKSIQGLNNKPDSGSV
jgi:hypothetical protein